LIEQEDVKTEFDLKATVFDGRFSFRIIPKGTKAGDRSMSAGFESKFVEIDNILL